MTLISFFLSKESSIILGDILTSIETSEPTSLILPTLGPISTNLSTHAQGKPYGFCQKANILSPQLAIAWAGKYSDAQSLFSQIIGSKNHINPKIENILEISNDFEENSDLQIIGSLLCQDKLHYFSRKCMQKENFNNDIRIAIVGGTGTNSLLKFTRSLAFKVTEGELSSTNNLIGNSIGIIGLLLSEEIRRGTTIKELFGAGYEIVYINKDNCFSKFSDITYVFWKINIDRKTGIKKVRPILLLKYYYHFDYLIIRSITITEENEYKESVSKVPPVISTTPIDEKIPKQSFNSKYLMVIFTTEIDGKVYCFSNIGFYHSVDSCPIKFNEDDLDNLEFSVDEKFINNAVDNFLSDIHI